MWGKTIGAVTILSAATLASTAWGAEQRFRATAAGNITVTGNALGLSKQDAANGPGTGDSIGTFMTLNAASTDVAPPSPANPWGPGTTNDWMANGSSADLLLPEDDPEILYAELVWGGSSAYGTEDVTALLDTPVTFSFGGDEAQIAPDSIGLTIMEQSSQGFAANYYMRSADVTAFVAEHLAGTYSVEGVPATQDTAIDSSNAAGWTLVVAYRDSSEPIRNLTIYSGGSFVDEDATETYAFDGFCTPPQGDFEGSIVVSTIEGDADRDGDSLAIAETIAGPYTTLFGVNNPGDNFFCSQINDENGVVDTAGTFGNANHDAQNGVNTIGGRQSWDITRVPVSSRAGHLVNDQTEATILTRTLDDSYVPTTVAFAIAVNAPDFTGASGDAAPLLLAIDETSTVTIDMQNVGQVDATSVSFSAPLPAGLELDSFAIDGNDGDASGAPVDAAGLAAGVDIGNVGPGTAHTITFVVRSSGEPEGAPDYVISSGWSYDYVSCAGEDALTEPHNLPDIHIDFDGEPSESGSSSSGGGADGSSSGGGEESTSDSNSDSAEEGSASLTATITITDTASDSDSDSASDSDTDGVGEAGGDNGCGCTTQGNESPLWAIGLFAIGGILRRRRN